MGGALEVKDAYGQANRAAPESTAPLSKPLGGLNHGAGPARYRAPPSIGDIQAAFKIETRGTTPHVPAQPSERSSTKPSIPGLALQDLGAQTPIHAQTERPPIVSHAIRPAGFQYPLPSGHLNNNQVSEEYFQHSRAPRVAF